HAPASAQVRVVQYPHGRYELRGDGVTTAYQWVWVVTAEPTSPALAEHLPASLPLTTTREATRVYASSVGLGRVVVRPAGVCFAAGGARALAGQHRRRSRATDPCPRAGARPSLCRPCRRDSVLAPPPRQRRGVCRSLRSVLPARQAPSRLEARRA